MTIKEAIQIADDMRPNALSDDIKLRWINELEGKVQTDVFLLAPAEIISYNLEDDAEKELLVAPPHDKIYYEYLAARIDYANGDYSDYNATIEMFNSFWREFVAWFANSYRPADMHGETYDLNLRLDDDDFEGDMYR